MLIIIIINSNLIHISVVDSIFVRDESNYYYINTIAY